MKNHNKQNLCITDGNERSQEKDNYKLQINLGHTQKYLYYIYKKVLDN